MLILELYYIDNTYTFYLSTIFVAAVKIHQFSILSVVSVKGF